MASWTKFNGFVEALAEGVHNLGADTLKVMLTDNLPDAANTVFADLTEIAAANGYTAGGSALTITGSSQTGGTYTLANDALTFTAAGGAIGPFRYAVLFNDTAANDELIAWFDYGTSYTLPDGLTFTLGAGTVLTLA